MNTPTTNNPPFSIDRFTASKRLLTLPEVATRLVMIAQQAEPDLDEAARVIRTDPAISAKILKTANSALFAFRNKSETIEDALPQLGMSMLRTLILSFHLARHNTPQVELRPVLREYWRSSLTQATLAEMLAERFDGVDPSTYFLAALLQDIGILAMMSEAPQDYLNHVLDRARFPRVVSAERNHFGFSHIDVSCAMLEQWGLRDQFCHGIRHHHDQIVPADQTDSCRLAVILAAASQGAEMLLSYRDKSPNSTVPEWANFLETRLELNESQAAEIIDQVTHRVREYSDLFTFDIGERVCPDRAIAEAKELLEEIALRNQLELAQEVKLRKRSIDEEQLYRDCLTGLYNRRFLNDKLIHHFMAAVDRRSPVGLLFIDIDRFKRINDNHGHAVGDQAIRHVADGLRRTLRHHDIAIRLGGDEFLVMICDVQQAPFQRIVNRIGRDEVSLAIAETSQIDISLSIGCVYYLPQADTVPDLNGLIDRADQAMYHSKRQGGGCSTLYVADHGHKTLETATC
ncbi:MAG TPA: GGDEF domain-containing protein [Pirellulaceae bacterium]|nr:GGDEF domain-containing protein [Pirellulaceae bacterium]